MVAQSPLRVQVRRQLRAAKKNMKVARGKVLRGASGRKLKIRA